MLDELGCGALCGALAHAVCALSDLVGPMPSVHGPYVQDEKWILEKHTGQNRDVGVQGMGAGRSEGRNGGGMVEISLVEFF